MPWFYIDALDPLGGIAFASLREPDLTAEAVTDDVPCWYIVAPEFEPVSVSSRMIGLAAAARGTFQLGFSLDGETELAFPTLAALAEFVRRLYLSGGAGDGPGGIGPDWPVEPPEGGGRPEGLEEFSVEGENIRNILIDFAEQISTASGELSLVGDPNKAAKALDLGVRQAPTVLRLGEEAFALSSYAIFCVSHAAFDLVRSREDLSEETMAEMSKSIQVVTNWIGAFRLTSPYRRQLAASLRDRLKENPTLFDTVFPDFFGGGVSLPPVWSRDPLDLLATLPVPDFVLREADRASHRTWRSLKDLFFGCLGSPELLISGVHSADRQALFWLAAVVLCQGGQGVPFSLATSRLVGADDRFFADVLAWLKAQMPTHAYAPALETGIEESGRV